MDFVDWCGHVLKKLIEAGRDPHIDEIRLAQILYGEEFRTEGDFHHSSYRRGMLDAVEELSNLGLLDERDRSFWTVTPEGRAFAVDPTPLWQRLCSVTLEPDEQRILKVVNALGSKIGSDPQHSWLEEIDREPLLKEYGINAGMDMLEVLWPVSEDLERRGLVYRDARPGYALNLKPTYAGLVWETRRGLLRKCDVFISHASDERAAAISLQEFLSKAFGEGLKVFVSSDYHSIPGGKVWFTELLDALKSAPVTLLLLSQGSVGRRWLNFEAGVGIGAGNLVIPLAVTGFPKEDVGHPLSELQARSLSDPDDVSGMLSDISTHLDRPLEPVDAGAFSAAESAAGGAKLEAVINQVPEGDKQHKLIVRLVNNSTKTLSDHRVEAEIPNALLNQSTGYGAEVVERRTQEYRYFRAYGKDRNPKVLHPGDVIRQFFIVSLVIPSDAEESGMLDKKIVVTVFAGDVMTQRIEKSVREILQQPPNFG